MDTLLKSFSIGFLLRGLFAGVFFVFSYCVATTGSDKRLNINSENIYSVGLPLALVSGVIVYGLHRSLAFPIVEWIFNLKCAKTIRQNWCPLISENTIVALGKRCDEKSKKATKNGRITERAKYMEAWADYIHLQYTSGWCIIAGSIVGAIISDGHFLNHEIDKWLRALTIIFFIAALTSNWRSHSVEEYWDKHLPPKDAQPSNQDTPQSG